jgi:hypothetical protein
MGTKLKILIFTIILFSGFSVGKTVSAAITIRPMLNTGLVGYWAMDEGVGMVVNDQSGNRNTGTLTQMDPATDWVDGKLGKALDFNASNHYVNAGNNNTLNLYNTNFTISVWIYLRNYNASYASDIVGRASPTGTSGYDFKIQGLAASTPRKIGFHNFGATLPDGVSSNSDISLSVWHHVAITYNLSGSTTSFYLDGIADGGGEMGAQNNSAAVDTIIGIDPRDLSGYNFDGQIDEVRVYNRALSAGEVTRLYTLTKPKILSANTTGLVGYWSFNEGLGTQAGDMSGRGNNGTASGSPVWVEGKRGRALDFNGSSDNVSLPDPGTNSIFDITNELSIFAWIKPNELSGYNVIVEKQNIAGTDYSYIFDTYDNELFFDAYDGANPAVTTNNANLEAGQWYYVGVVFSWDQDTIKFYKNGAEIYQYIGLPNLINPNNVPIYMGGNSHDGGVYFDGPIDEVRIYNRALSATEVAGLYNSSKKIIKLNTSQNNKVTDGLVGMWSFNGPDISGNTAFDRSGSGNNGTINGASIINGKVGQALKFDGNDYINCGSNVSSSSNYTMSVWVNTPASVPQANVSILSRRGAISTDANYILNLFADDQGADAGKVDFAHVNISNGVDATPGTSDIRGKGWTHIAAEYDGTYQRLYVNGVQENYLSASSPKTTGVQEVNIGRDAYEAAGYWNGLIDEVRVYNRALTATEINRLYNMGK